MRTDPDARPGLAARVSALSGCLCACERERAMKGRAYTTHSRGLRETSKNFHRQKPKLVRNSADKVKAPRIVHIPRTCRLLGSVWEGKETVLFSPQIHSVRCGNARARHRGHDLFPILKHVNTLLTFTRIMED